MADGEVTRSIDEALNKIVKTTDKSGNMKKELKKKIYQNVSTLKNLYLKMKEKLEEGMRLKEQMDNENNALKTELDVCRKVANNTNTESNRETSKKRDREPPITSS
jgi:predicted nuclease with TOPRIM domain